MAAATVVRAYKGSRDPGITHCIHYDDGGTERVGLEDDDPTIVLLDEAAVLRCTCRRCRKHSRIGRALPLLA